MTRTKLSNIGKVSCDFSIYEKHEDKITFEYYKQATNNMKELIKELSTKLFLQVRELNGTVYKDFFVLRIRLNGYSDLSSSSVFPYEISNVTFNTYGNEVTIVLKLKKDQLN